MKYILELNHPKHYYQFKHIRKNLINCGNEVVVLARDKDVLLNVLQEENVDYLIFGRHRKKWLLKFGELFLFFGIMLK